MSVSHGYKYFIMNENDEKLIPNNELYLYEFCLNDSYCLDYTFKFKNEYIDIMINFSDNQRRVTASSIIYEKNILTEAKSSGVFYNSTRAFSNNYEKFGEYETTNVKIPFENCKNALELFCKIIDESAEILKKHNIN